MVLYPDKRFARIDSEESWIHLGFSQDTYEIHGTCGALNLEETLSIIKECYEEAKEAKEVVEKLKEEK